MGYSTPCWIRVGHRNNKGYGKVVIAGRMMFAHRAMYEQEIGPIPPGEHIDHLCNQRACMRPDHLRIASPAENVQRGKNAKLSADDVRAIRAKPPTVKTHDLAAAYGISPSQMSRVRNGKRWRNV